MKSLTVRIRPSRGLSARLASIVWLTALFAAAPFHTALAQVAPNLNTAQSFAVLAGSTVTNTGPTVVTGDLGVDPGLAVTGFPPGTVIGAIVAGGEVALQAKNDLTAAYLDLEDRECTADLTGQNLGGLNLGPGIYCFSSEANLTGTLTLNAGGDPNAVWIFQIGSTLVTAASTPVSSVLVTNGGQLCNVFWQVGSSATIEVGTEFVGSILALTSIGLNTGANVSGRALARNGAVTMDSNRVGITACAVTPDLIPPTLNKAFNPASIDENGTSVLTITLFNRNVTAATLEAPLIDTLPDGVVVADFAFPANNCGGTFTAIPGASTVTLSAGASIPANGSCRVRVRVTSASAGTYINSLGIGALETSNGDNPAPAVATLVVNPVTPPEHEHVPPTLVKAFSPATINQNGFSTLTITLSNPNGTDATLTAPLIDTLPPGVVISSPVFATTTCSGSGEVEATGGGNTVALPAGSSIPANGSCTVTVCVTAAVAGSYFNVLLAGALVTDLGDNAAPALATLVVLPRAPRHHW